MKKSKRELNEQPMPAQKGEEDLDDAIADSFPASDPVALTASTIARPPVREESKPYSAAGPAAEANLDERIREHARKLWEQDGRPQGHGEDYIEKARELVAIEDNQDSAKKPNPVSHPQDDGPFGEPVEPLEAVENVGEFPDLTDQGESHYPTSKNSKA